MSRYVVTTFVTLAWMCIFVILVGPGGGVVTEIEEGDSMMSVHDTLCVDVDYRGTVCYEKGMFLEFGLADMPDSVYAERVAPVKDSLRYRAKQLNWGDRGYYE